MSFSRRRVALLFAGAVSVGLLAVPAAMVFGEQPTMHAGVLTADTVWSFGPNKLSDNVTVPAGVSLTIPDSGTLDLNGKTLTVSGTLLTPTVLDGDGNPVPHLRIYSSVSGAGTLAVAGGDVQGTRLDSVKVALSGTPVFTNNTVGGDWGGYTAAAGTSLAGFYDNQADPAADAAVRTLALNTTGVRTLENSTDLASIDTVKLYNASTSAFATLNITGTPALAGVNFQPLTANTYYPVIQSTGVGANIIDAEFGKVSVLSSTTTATLNVIGSTGTGTKFTLRDYDKVTGTVNKPANYSGANISLAGHARAERTVLDSTTVTLSGTPGFTYNTIAGDSAGFTVAAGTDLSEFRDNLATADATDTARTLLFNFAGTYTIADSTDLTGITTVKLHNASSTSKAAVNIFGEPVLTGVDFQPKSTSSSVYPVVQATGTDTVLKGASFGKVNIPAGTASSPLRLDQVTTNATSLTLAQTDTLTRSTLNFTTLTLGGTYQLTGNSFTSSTLTLNENATASGGTFENSTVKVNGTAALETATLIDTAVTLTGVPNFTGNTIASTPGTTVGKVTVAAGTDLAGMSGITVAAGSGPEAGTITLACTTSTQAPATKATPEGLAPFHQVTMQRSGTGGACLTRLNLTSSGTLAGTSFVTSPNVPGTSLPSIYLSPGVTLTMPGTSLDTVALSGPGAAPYASLESSDGTFTDVTLKNLVLNLTRPTIIRSREILAAGTSVIKNAAITDSTLKLTDQAALLNDPDLGAAGTTVTASTLFLSGQAAVTDARLLSSPITLAGTPVFTGNTLGSVDGDPDGGYLVLDGTDLTGMHGNTFLEDAAPAVKSMKLPVSAPIVQGVQTPAPALTGLVDVELGYYVYRPGGCDQYPSANLRLTGNGSISGTLIHSKDLIATACAYMMYTSRATVTLSPEADLTVDNTTFRQVSLNADGSGLPKLAGTSTSFDNVTGTGAVEYQVTRPSIINQSTLTAAGDSLLQDGVVTDSALTLKEHARLAASHTPDSTRPTVTSSTLTIDTAEITTPAGVEGAELVSTTLNLDGNPWFQSNTLTSLPGTEAGGINVLDGTDLIGYAGNEYTSVASDSMRTMNLIVQTPAALGVQAPASAFTGLKHVKTGYSSYTSGACTHYTPAALRINGDGNLAEVTFQSLELRNQVGACPVTSTRGSVSIKYGVQVDTTNATFKNVTLTSEPAPAALGLLFGTGTTLDGVLADTSVPRLDLTAPTLTGNSIIQVVENSELVDPTLAGVTLTLNDSARIYDSAQHPGQPSISQSSVTLNGNASITGTTLAGANLTFNGNGTFTSNTGTGNTGTLTPTAQLSSGFNPAPFTSGFTLLGRTPSSSPVLPAGTSVTWNPAAPLVFKTTPTGTSPFLFDGTFTSAGATLTGVGSPAVIFNGSTNLSGSFISLGTVPVKAYGSLRADDASFQGAGLTYDGTTNIRSLYAQRATFSYLSATGRYNLRDSTFTGNALLSSGTSNAETTSALEYFTGNTVHGTMTLAGAYTPATFHDNQEDTGGASQIKISGETTIRTGFNPTGFPTNGVTLNTRTGNSPLLENLPGGQAASWPQGAPFSLTGGKQYLVNTPVDLGNAALRSTTSAIATLRLPPGSIPGTPQVTNVAVVLVDAGTATIAISGPPTMYVTATAEPMTRGGAGGRVSIAFSNPTAATVTLKSRLTTTASFTYSGIDTDASDPGIACDPLTNTTIIECTATLASGASSTVVLKISPDTDTVQPNMDSRTNEILTDTIYQLDFTAGKQAANSTTAFYPTVPLYIPVNNNTPLPSEEEAAAAEQQAKFENEGRLEESVNGITTTYWSRSGLAQAADFEEALQQTLTNCSGGQPFTGTSEGWRMWLMGYVADGAVAIQGSKMLNYAWASGQVILALNSLREDPTSACRSSADAAIALVPGIQGLAAHAVWDAVLIRASMDNSHAQEAIVAAQTTGLCYMETLIVVTDGTSVSYSLIYDTWSNAEVNGHRLECR